MQCRRCQHRFKPALLPLIGGRPLRCPACSTHVAMRDGALAASLIVTVAIVFWLLQVLPDELGPARETVAASMGVTAGTLLSVIALLLGLNDVSPPPERVPQVRHRDWLNTRFGLFVVAVAGCGGWAWLVAQHLG